MDRESTDSEPADEDLLRRLSSDPVAFEVFYRRHVDRVIGFAARRVTDPADAADLVAATFLTDQDAARSYDPGRGEPGAWLLGITARLIVNARRRKVRESAALARIAGRRLIDQSDIERLEERIDAARSSRAVGRTVRPARGVGVLAGDDPGRLGAADGAGRRDRRPGPARHSGAGGSPASRQ